MRKKLKKTVSFLLLIFMLGSSMLLASCNNGDSGSTDAPATDAPATDAPATDAPATDAPATDAPTVDSEKENQDLEANEIKVLRVISPLKKGDMIVAEDIMMCVEKRDAIPTGAITDIAAVLGKYAIKDISMGAYIYSSDLSIVAVEPDSDADGYGDMRDEIKDELYGELRGEISAELREELKAELRAELEAELRAEIANGGINAADLGYVVITDYLQPNTGEDVSDAIQKVINENPRKTIYFPDGEYLISKPICTSSNPDKAVSLHLANFAVIKASDAWNSDEAMIRLGGDNDRVFTTGATGSNYYLYGGCIDGSYIAKGVSIDSGRETSIRNVSIKFATVGLHVKYNEEYGSNDADIDTVNIIGPYAPDTIGLIIDGFDNTFTNMRIAGFQIGVKLTGAGNFLRNLHPLYSYSTCDYEDSIGFLDLSGGNWYDICYPDNFAIGFYMTTHAISVYNACFCYWYSSSGNTEIAFFVDGEFNSVLNNCKSSFRHDANGEYLVVTKFGGKGVVQSPLFDEDINYNDAYKEYLVGKVIWN